MRYFPTVKFCKEWYKQVTVLEKQTGSSIELFESLKSDRMPELFKGCSIMFYN